jgi:hypothetical protein
MLISHARFEAKMLDFPYLYNLDELDNQLYFSDFLNTLETHGNVNQAFSTDIEQAHFQKEPNIPAPTYIHQPASQNITITESDSLLNPLPEAFQKKRQFSEIDTHEKPTSVKRGRITSRSDADIELKKERRREKNRISAQKSREIKRLALIEKDSIIEELRLENAQLKQKIAQMEAQQFNQEPYNIAIKMPHKQILVNYEATSKRKTLTISQESIEPTITPVIKHMQNTGNRNRSNF